MNKKMVQLVAQLLAAPGMLTYLASGRSKKGVRRLKVEGKYITFFQICGLARITEDFTRPNKSVLKRLLKSRRSSDLCQLAKAMATVGYFREPFMGIKPHKIKLEVSNSFLYAGSYEIDGCYKKLTSVTDLCTIGRLYNMWVDRYAHVFRFSYTTKDGVVLNLPQYLGLCITQVDTWGEYKYTLAQNRAGYYGVIKLLKKLYGYTETYRVELKHGVDTYLGQHNAATRWCSKHQLGIHLGHPDNMNALKRVYKNNCFIDIYDIAAVEWNSYEAKSFKDYTPLITQRTTRVMGVTRGKKVYTFKKHVYKGGIGLVKPIYEYIFEMVLPPSYDAEYGNFYELFKEAHTNFKECMLSDYYEVTIAEGDTEISPDYDNITCEEFLAFRTACYDVLDYSRIWILQAVQERLVVRNSQRFWEDSMTEEEVEEDILD